MKYDKTWIIIADGSRARVFLNEGPGSGLAPALNHVLVADNRPSGDISSDRPGRTFDSVGAGRHAMPPTTDPHRHAQSSFAHDIANVLEENRNKQVFERLIIVAAPKMLGDLRAVLGDQTRKLIKAELAKDLTKLAVHDLNAHLSELIKL